MLTAVLVLQAFILLLIIVLSIVGWRKLTENGQKLTEQLTKDRRKLTEDRQELTEQLIEDQQKLTEQLTETSQKLTQVLSIQLYDRGKLTEDQQKLTETSQKLTETSQKLTEKLTENRVSVSYEHVIHHEDGLFRNKVVASYRVQFLYDGLPIGEPTEKIVYHANKVDKEVVQETLTAALQTLQIAIEASGIPLRVLNKVDDVIKNLSKK